MHLPPKLCIFYLLKKIDTIRTEGEAGSVVSGSKVNDLENPHKVRARRRPLT